MKVAGNDERMLGSERGDADFLVFVYEGGDRDEYSWSVDSYLLAETDLAGVLLWLRGNLPTECCWSLGVVQRPTRATADSGLDVAWIVGGDVLNVDPSNRSPEQERLAQEMLKRRHSVQFV